MFKNVDKLATLPNVWFDFSAICESPAMMYIIQKVGIKRCMWGTDYPGSMLLGKPVAMGDTFYWISSEDCNNFKPATTFHPCHIVTEEFLAIEQASILLNLKDKDVEDLFYNNANNLFNR